MNKNALIAMSGGVDSSVAALLMQEQGYHCTGVTMKLFNNEDIGLPVMDSKCCSLDDIQDAKSVCGKMGMEHFTFNYGDRFRKEVIDRFINAYMHGMTPNPCIDCNRYLKFGELFDKAILPVRSLAVEPFITVGAVRNAADTRGFDRYGFITTAGAGVQWRLTSRFGFRADAAYQLFTTGTSHNAILLRLASVAFF